jgi:glycine cleavage system aminomethyltransferase T
MNQDLISKLAHPFYGDHVLYHAYDLRPGMPTFRAWAFNGWQKESLSWRNGCYIHAGLSRSGPISIKGPEAKKYLQSLERFAVGCMKHGVMCTEDGLIAAHGIIERKGEDHFESFAGGPPGQNMNTATPFDVELKRLDHYLFQIAGPTSLQVLEKATGEGLRDVKFLHFRDTTINGIRTEIARIGMTGGLAYELHGPIEEGPAIYEAVYRAGQEFGIERLGWGTYLVNHVEGGFPQGTWTFVPAAPAASRLEAMRLYQVSGSVDPTNTRARMRTPVEVRWHNMARFDHDFVGREALAAEIANPKRTTVTLRWNAEDVIDTYTSLLRSGVPYKPVDVPYAPQRWPMAHADHILVDGSEVGYASGTIYSPHFREFLSLGCIDVEAGRTGNEVVVQWGDHGGPIKNIRAIVGRFPYFTERRNSDLDVATIPAI